MIDLEKICDRGLYRDREVKLTILIKQSDYNRLERICKKTQFHSLKVLTHGILLSFLDEYEQLQQDLADLPDQEVK